MEFLNTVYSLFGFTFDLVLSTRPEGYLGDLEDWNKAEKALADALDDSKFPWRINPGDGAFYGPKIDITINDALKRPRQCATIQLDFQLPLRFNLSYSAEDGTKKRPVIIHRAILGSVERFIAILIESFAGKWYVGFEFQIATHLCFLGLSGFLPDKPSSCQLDQVAMLTQRMFESNCLMPDLKWTVSWTPA